MLEQYAEAFGRKDLAGVAALLADDVVLEDPGNHAVGKAAVLKLYEGLFTNEFLGFDVLDTYRLDADRVAFRFSFRLRTPAGQEIQVRGIDCLTFAAGRIQRLVAYLA